MSITRITYFILILLIPTYTLCAQDSSFVQTEVIYGRKDGMALTMIIAKPKTYSNGKGIVQVISGGYNSFFQGWRGWRVSQAKSFVANGYTVFAVIHSSQPRYTIPDALLDLQRAVKYIRYHAKDYAIDAEKIGVTGTSSGGNLALLVGLMDGIGNPKARDPIDQLSSKVQAVACFAPPSDFLNWRNQGDNLMSNEFFNKYPALKPPFDFKQWDTTRFNYVWITDTTAINKTLKELSPINYVTHDDPPVFIIHGDEDELVPIQQSELLMTKLQEQKIPSELSVKKGGTHEALPKGQKAIEQEYIDWFDKYLK